YVLQVTSPATPPPLLPYTTLFRSARRRPRRESRSLKLIKSSLAEMARVALAEPFMLSIERQEIFLRRLPKALNGLRIVHLSDLQDRKSTRLNSSHVSMSYAVFCLK